MVAMDGRSVDGGASSVGGGPTGNRVGPRSDLVRTPQHLLYAGAASLTRRPMRAVLVELGRVVRPLFYCPGLKGSTSTALLVSPPSSETCGGSVAAVVGARGDGGGGGSDGRSVDGGASSVGGGPTGNRVGPRSDLVRTPQHLLYAGAASLTRRPMRAVLVELGRVVRPLFYCPGLKGSTSTALLVSPPSSETCGGSMAAAAGARGGGVGGVAGGGSLVGVTRVSGPAALAAAAGGGLSGIGGTGCVTGRSHGA